MSIKVEVKDGFITIKQPLDPNSTKENKRYRTVCRIEDSVEPKLSEVDRKYHKWYPSDGIPLDVVNAITPIELDSLMNELKAQKNKRLEADWYSVITDIEKLRCNINDYTPDSSVFALFESELKALNKEYRKKLKSDAKAEGKPSEVDVA